MNTKAFFPCWEVSNLILEIGTENQYFFLELQPLLSFSSNCQKMTLWHKKKSLPTKVDLYDPYMVPYTIP